MTTKISSEVIENGAITEAKLASSCVTNDKLASGISSSKLSGALPAIDGSSLTGISTYADSDVKSLFNVTGSAPRYACRAWVNFNGTGTVAIRASVNVSSVTDAGTGIYTVNFGIAMPDVNYSIGGGALKGGTPNTLGTEGAAFGVINSSSCIVYTQAWTGDLYGSSAGMKDTAQVFIQIFR